MRTAIANSLEKHYKWIFDNTREDLAYKQVIMGPQMVALAACHAEASPQIIEFEQNGDSDFHEYFHAIGSGGRTAYAVWRTLGGSRLRELPEGKAIQVALRIMRTAVDVDMWGVSDPFTVFVVDGDGTRSLAGSNLDAEIEAAQRLEELQVRQLLGVE